MRIGVQGEIVTCYEESYLTNQYQEHMNDYMYMDLVCISGYLYWGLLGSVFEKPDDAFSDAVVRLPRDQQSSAPSTAISTKPRNPPQKYLRARASL